MKRLTVFGLSLIAIVTTAATVHAADLATVLKALDFPSDTEAKVRAGEFVEISLPTSMERDLNVGLAFLVKQPPEKLLGELRGDLLLEKVDPTTIAYGKLEGEGSMDQLAGLKLTADQTKAYAAAKAGTDLNLSSEEIASLRSAGKDAAAIQTKVHELLLARYRAYRSKGIAGIAPYDRGGSQRDVAADFKAIDRKARQVGLPSAEFWEFMDRYPEAKPSSLKEVFYWSQFKAHGADTIALVHGFEGVFGGIPVRVGRHYYASTGYNLVQTVAGFLPVAEGTLVIYTNRTSTDQLEGFGAGAKRSIGRKLMAGELEELFKKAAAQATGAR